MSQRGTEVLSDTGLSASGISDPPSSGATYQLSSITAPIASAPSYSSDDPGDVKKDDDRSHGISADPFPSKDERTPKIVLGTGLQSVKPDSISDPNSDPHTDRERGSESTGDSEGYPAAAKRWIQVAAGRTREGLLAFTNKMLPKRNSGEALYFMFPMVCLWFIMMLCGADVKSAWIFVGVFSVGLLSFGDECVICSSIGK